VVREFSAPDYALIQSIEPELKAMGFSLEPFGTRTMLINGVPPDILEQDAGKVLDQLIEQIHKGGEELKLDTKQAVAAKLAGLLARTGQISSEPSSLIALIEQLFACNTANYSPSGKSTVQILRMDELSARFGKS
jgi:DNA mismatch repair protein MutL